MTDYPVGTVADISLVTGRTRRAMRVGSGAQALWSCTDGTTVMPHEEASVKVRRVAEDGEVVVSAAILRRMLDNFATMDDRAILRTALDEQTKPPRPTVPTTLDSKVRCDDGSEWVLVDPESASGLKWFLIPWRPATDSSWRRDDWIAEHITEVLRVGGDS